MREHVGCVLALDGPNCDAGYVSSGSGQWVAHPDVQQLRSTMLLDAGDDPGLVFVVSSRRIPRLSRDPLPNGRRCYRLSAPSLRDTPIRRGACILGVNPVASLIYSPQIHPDRDGKLNTPAYCH